MKLGPGRPCLTLTQPQTCLVPQLLQVQEAFLDYPQHRGPPSTTYPDQRLPPSQSISQAIPLPGICPRGKNRGLCKHLHAHTFTAAPFVTARKWKQPADPLTGNRQTKGGPPTWLNDHVTTGRNDPPTQATVWVNLRSITLSEEARQEKPRAVRTHLHARGPIHRDRRQARGGEGGE